MNIHPIAKFIIYFIKYIKSTPRLIIQFIAVYIAYNCNKKSKVNNPVTVAIIAFIFPEIYLIQAAVRKYILNEYKCKENKEEEEVKEEI